MSEDKPDYLHPKGELRFVRLKNTLEDLVGYVSANEGHLTIYQPLTVEIETLFDEGRQILALKEYLPQSIIDLREIKIPVADIMFIAPVKWDFYDQYKNISEFFYGSDRMINNISAKSRQQKNKPKIEKNQENKENVISILEALSKKDKPIH